MIYIISSGLDTVIKQLTDSTIREYVVDGLLPERDYAIAVRGYYQLLGPAGTTSVRLEGIVDNHTQYNCIIHNHHLISFCITEVTRENKVTLLYLDMYMFHFL